VGLSRTEFLNVESVAAVCDAHRFNRIASSATREFRLPYFLSLPQHFCLTRNVHTARCAIVSALSFRASAVRCARSFSHIAASRNHASRTGATREVREAALRGEAHLYSFVM